LLLFLFLDHADERVIRFPQVVPRAA